MLPWVKAALGTIAVAVVAGGIAYVSGVRIFVIQPIGAIPDGITVIVAGAPGLRFVDSPDAFCLREQGGVNLLCRGAVAGRVAQEGKILMRLPYNGFLYRLSGAPDVSR